LKAGHEIAHHSYAHSDPSEQSPDEERRDMERALESLAKIGFKPLGYRSPSADVSAVEIERVCLCEVLFPGTARAPRTDRSCGADGRYAEAIPTETGKSCFQEIASLAGKRSLATTPLF